MTNLVKPK